MDEIIDGWSAKANQLGIREYYSVNTWDRDMPAHARGESLDYLNETIPKFNAKGARFFSAEPGDNWGPSGLGYFLAARMLWDVSEAQHTEALVEDFLTRAFGPAKEPMRDFYQQLDGSRPHPLVADQLAHMFRALNQARQLANTPDIHTRLNDLVLYARCVDLYLRSYEARGPERQQAFETLIRHAYQMRTTKMVHTKARYLDLARRDKSISIPSDAEWNVPEDRNP